MIKTHGFEYKKFYFPAGEMQVQIEKWTTGEPKLVSWFYDGKNEELLELLFIASALNDRGIVIDNLNIPYFPFGRQDRVNLIGEAFTLKVVANLINSINAKNVYINDPHSDVTTALINNVRVREQWQNFEHILEDKTDFWLVAPDGGALKKIYKLADGYSTPLGVVECSKIRSLEDGKVTGIKAHIEDLQGKDCYIVDDICGGGKPMIELAKELKKKNAGRIIMMVSHGLFTSGMEVFKGLFDEIYTKEGRIPL